MTMDMRGRAVAGAASASERVRAFRIAGRHTWLVRGLRVMLPVLAVGLCLSYAITLITSLPLGPGRLDVGQVELTPDDMTMKNPKYFGVNKDGSRYEVRAKRAVLELNAKAPIKLMDIEGDLVQPSNVVTKLKSKNGTLDNGKGELELYDGIEIDASNGMSARMSRATVYSKEHRVVSKEPVHLTMPTGTVRGASMTMKTDTQESTLVGDVAVNLVPTSQQSTAGFGRDARQPVDVTAQQLYINDAKHIALFTGNVVALQGDTTLKTPELRIAYEGKAADSLTSGQTGAAKSEAKDGGSRLSRMVASNGTVITMGTDRRITADQADFDAKANTALFTGNVLVNQQKNVLQGRRLFVDRKNSKSRLDSPAEGGQPVGRITAMLVQGESKAARPAKPKSAAAAEMAAAVGGNVLGTFKADPNAPMDIEANTLDILDATKQAVFRTNVKAQQGDLVIRTVELTAHYTGQAAFGIGGAGDDSKDGKGVASQLTRVDAREKVLITSKDGQTATGDWATFDVKANTVLLVGHVVVSRGKDVAEGPRLKIDLTTGMYRFEVENEAGVRPSTTSVQEAPKVPKATGPALSSSAAETPTGRTCPPGKQCLLFFPQDAKDRAKGLIEKKGGPIDEAWRPSTSGSSVIRGN